MKVLFAVSNENITTSVISKYQQKYKEIVTSKNVYYFNAIIKELQNDRSYDAIVIGEDLEPISNNNYDVIDKFIIEKLDIISDEASKSSGEDIPIIFICSDRRTKSDQLLRNLFSMGIYNALVGNDRSLDKVCSLINKPRNKKEAKKYYMIDGDDSIEYEPASEELVSEEQLRNILTYYKKIGNDEKKCVQAFESIASQYNNAQLRLIVKVLPMEVKAILETSSPVYQKLMENGTVLSNGKYSPYTLNDPKEPGKLDFIEKDISTNKLTRPVVIPSNLDFSKQKDPTLTNNNTGINSIGIQQKYTNNNRIRNQQINQPNNIQPPKQQYNQYYNAYNNTNQQQYQNQGYTQYQSRYGTISPYNPYNPYNQYNQYNQNNKNNQYNPYSSNNNNLNGIPNGNLQSQFKPTSNNMTTPKNQNKQDKQNSQNIQDKQDRQNSQNIQDIQNSQHIQNNEIVNSENGENKNGISQLQANNIQTNNIQNEVATPVKKRRGRPKKTKVTVENTFSPITPAVEEPVTGVADGPAIVVTAPVAEEAPVEAPAADKPVEESAPVAPKRRGRPKKSETATATAEKAAPKKRGRKPAAAKAAEAVEEVKAAPKRRGRKPAAVKAAEAAEEVKAAPKRRGRKPAADKTSKTTVKRTGTRGRKKASEETVEETYFQFDGVGDILAEDVKERVKEAYKAEGHRVAMIHTLQIYVNVNESRAYYVINGKPENKYIDL